MKESFNTQNQESLTSLENDLSSLDKSRKKLLDSIDPNHHFQPQKPTADPDKNEQQKKNLDYSTKTLSKKSFFELIEYGAFKRLLDNFPTIDGKEALRKNRRGRFISSLVKAGKISFPKGSNPYIDYEEEQKNSEKTKTNLEIENEKDRKIYNDFFYIKKRNFI